MESMEPQERHCKKSSPTAIVYAKPEASPTKGNTFGAILGHLPLSLLQFFASSTDLGARLYSFP